MQPSTPEAACFEAGVKFGSLYHQFAGTPVSPASADSLAAAMEAAIENQPYCERVSIEMHPDRIAADAPPDYGYTELTGRHFDAELTVEHEGVAVEARMALIDGYPRMRIETVSQS